MNGAIRRIGTILVHAGLDPRKMIAAIRFAPAYVVGLFSLLRERQRWRQTFGLRIVPVLSDRHAASGVATGHYFHQDLWAARRIYERKPRRHIDVGSRVDGFIAHLLTFRDVDVLDVRALDSQVRGLRFRQADIMAGVPGETSDSVSCLHALEHFGLGRYGDPISFDGWERGFRNIAAMVATGGSLYVSVPIGPQVIEFNAQRLFAPATLVQIAEGHGLQLVQFSYVDDAGMFHEDCLVEQAKECLYGCGCYEFRRDS